MSKAQEIVELMESQRNEAQRQILMGFFKTGSVMRPSGRYSWGSSRQDLVSMALEMNSWG